MNPVIKILIVDDVPKTLSVFVELFEVTFQLTSPTIVTAGTVDEARAALQAARDDKAPFDVAILDTRLPLHENQVDTSDFSLGATARQWFPKIFIVQVTAFGDDKEILRFVPPEELRNPEVYAYIPKAPGWMPSVVAAVENALHARRLRETFERLFTVEEGAGHLVAARHRAVERCAQDRRLEVAALCDEAGRRWDELPETLQRDLDRVLGHAKDAAGKHVVGVQVVETDEAEEEAEASEDDDKAGPI